MRYREAWGFRPRQSFGLLRYLLGTRPTWRSGTAELNVYSPPVGSAAYSRYLRGLRRMGRSEWVPLVVHVSLTDRCPYRCRRCSNVARGGRDPTLEALARLGQQLRAAGTCRVALTGGEPLMRDDLPAVVEAYGPELSPVVFTSGYGLDAGRAEELRRSGLAAAFVSLDHFLPHQHDRVRGRPGAFDRAVDAIRACREAGLYTAAQAVVGRSLLAKGQLERFLAFCKGLGVHEVMLLEPVPVGRGPTDADVDQDARQRLAGVQLRAARDADLPKVSSMSWLESPECLGCQAGLSFFYVTARGEVFPCDFAPVSFGNVFELGVQEIHARLVRMLKRPSSACLARRLRRVYGEGRTCPLVWEEAEVILQGYQPGPLPRLLRYLCPEPR